jgi:hypothetical protein
LAMMLSVFVSFHLAMMLSVFCQFPFGHDIVCLLSVSLWPSYNIIGKGKLTKDRQHHGQSETDNRQTISWPKWNWQ